MKHAQRYAAAPIHRRLAAFLLDALVASLPIMVMLYLFSTSFLTPATVLYEAPVLGAATVIDLPLQVNQYMNDKLPTAQHYEATQLRNVSFGATVARVMSVFVLLFYLGYGTVCTMMYDGHTVGKYLMKLNVVQTKKGSFYKSMALREIVGKVLLNSTLIVPLISIITMLVTKEHLAIHDMIGSTRVVAIDTTYSGTGAASLTAFDEDIDDDEEEDEAVADDENTTDGADVTIADADGSSEMKQAERKA